MGIVSLFRVDKKSPSYQRELYRLHYKRIYNSCLRIIGDTMEAEEAMHDAFLKIFDHIDDLHDEKAFFSWSQRIAVRTSIDKIRKKRIIFEQIDEQTAYEEENEEEVTFSAEIIKKELNLLPDGYRMVLSMRLFENYDFEEIAQMLHIKESTVRSQYIRGRDKLARNVKAAVNSNYS
ncbi:MAG: RNA polymerase sigma factor [Bacteroidales bacterium]|nr:RNA polymerase sigma factor [Bacteroidales bacterium]